MITGQSEVLIDYYVEATDANGNLHRTDIQHVYVGETSTGDPGGGGGGPTTVTVSPDPPLRGQDVTVTYDPEGGPLAAAGQVHIHTGINGWNNVITPDPMMTDNGDGTWTYTFPVDACATVMDVVFNDGAGTWDNNAGADWHFAVDGPIDPGCSEDPTGAVSTAPSPPVRGEDVTITYRSSGRPLESAAEVRAHYGFNNWTPGAVTDPNDAAPMTEDQPGVWTVTFSVPGDATQVDVVFNDGAGTWDNNGNNDWHFPTVPRQQTGPGDQWLMN
jgi:hypothetical protein